MKHFINIKDIPSKDLRKILDDAKKRKNRRKNFNTLDIDKDRPLRGKLLIQMFEKPSSRTRLSFYLAIKQLGGGTLTLKSKETHLGKGGESLADTAKILSTYGDGFMLRTDNDKKLKEFDLRKIGIFEYVENGEAIIMGDSIEKIIDFPLFDTITINSDNKSRVIESLEFAYENFKIVTIIGLEDQIILQDYKKEFCCPSCLSEYKNLSPNKFSFNSPDGACKTCKGFGNILLPDMDLIVQDRNLSIYKGCISVLERPSLSWAKRKFIEYCEMNNIDLNKPYKDFNKSG